MNRYNEIISAMSDRLDEYHIPHTVHDCWEGAQIRFPWCNGDVAIHDGTYGHANGCVESYGFPWDDEDVSMLYPEEALTNIVAYFIESFQNSAKALINNYMEQG